MNPRQISVQEAFDRHSKSYDAQFSNVTIGERVRAEVWEIAGAAFSPPGRLLDLGAGTGEDAIHFARKGFHVTAIDLSPGMIDRLRLKAEAAGLSRNIDAVVSEMNRYRPPSKFDGFISNFGAINCVDDLSWLREAAETGLKPGARLVLTTMGLFYPLEMMVFILKGRPGPAFRRFKRPVDIAIEGAPVRVYYHSLRSMRRTLGPKFQLEQVRGLCSFSPSPGWEHLQRYSLLRWLAPLDRFICRLKLTATWADHFVSVWRYQP